MKFMKHPFTFFETYLPGVNHDNLFLVTSVFISGLLLIAAFMVYPRIRDASKNVIPDKIPTSEMYLRSLVEAFAGLCDDVIGHRGREFLPFLGTMFIFLLSLNMIGLIPGFLPPTEVWITGSALGLISLITFNYYGFKYGGPAYLKHFTAPLSISEIKQPVLWTLIAIPFFAFQIFFHKYRDH